MIDRLQRLHRRIASDGAGKSFEYFILILLLPFSLIWGCVSWLRHKFYTWHFFATFKADVPVVSVGNLAVGGTGKTPVVDWLIKDFVNRGKRVAVVSRGYGGTFTGGVGIVSNGESLLLAADRAGDEPYLLARRNPAVVVLVSRQRADGVKLAVDEFQVDIVILDDGFQHQAVHRDLDIVLLDASKPFGNGWPLPAGLLREFPRALTRSDIILLTRANQDSIFRFNAKPVFKSRHQIADTADSLAGQQVKLNDLMGLKLCAFAGIAEPEPFFNALRRAGLTIVNCLSLSDHCRYDGKQINRISAAAKTCDALITTEKDAVKLSKNMFSIACYSVPMTLVVDPESPFRETIYKRIWSSK